MSALSTTSIQAAGQTGAGYPSVFSPPLPFGYYPIKDSEELDYYEETLHLQIIGILEDWGVPPRDMFYALSTPADTMSGGQRTIFIAATKYSDVDGSWSKAAQDIKELLSEHGREDVEVEIWPTPRSFAVDLEASHDLAVNWEEPMKPWIAKILEVYCGRAWNDVIVHRLGCDDHDPFMEPTVTVKLDEEAQRPQWMAASKDIRHLLDAQGFSEVNLRFEYTTFFRYGLYNED